MISDLSTNTIFVNLLSYLKQKIAHKQKHKCLGSL